MQCSPSRRLSDPLAAGVPALARRIGSRPPAPDRSPPRRMARRPARRAEAAGAPAAAPSSARWSVCTVGATTRRARRKRWGPDSVLVPLGRQSRLSPARSNQESVVSAVESRRPALAGHRGRGVCGPCFRSGHVVSAASWGPVQASVSVASSQAGHVPAIGCIVATHAAEPSSPALRVASRVLSDQDLTAPHAGAGSRLVRHTTRPEKRGKEDTMNRWTGTAHLTKDPQLLETENGTAICTLRIAVKRAGKQGHDGYFDVKCFDAQANACAQYLKAGREIAVDGRLLFDEFQTQDGSYASRIYVVAERVEFLATGIEPQTVRPATRPPPRSPPAPARRARPPRPPDHHRGPAVPHRPRAIEGVETTGYGSSATWKGRPVVTTPTVTETRRAGQTNEPVELARYTVTARRARHPRPARPRRGAPRRRPRLRGRPPLRHRARADDDGRARRDRHRLPRAGPALGRHPGDRIVCAEVTDIASDASAARCGLARLRMAVGSARAAFEVASCVVFRSVPPAAAVRESFV